MTISPCRACGGVVDPILSFGPQPIVNRLLSRPDESSTEFLMAHGVCVRCGLIQNTSPIEAHVFYEQYDTPSSWKPEPHFARFMHHLTALVPREARMLDVGCNDGKFLEAAQENRFVSFGVEPSINTVQDAKSRGLAVYHGFFGSEFAQTLRSDIGIMDAVVSRQVLEHVVDLADFLAGVRHVLRPNGLLFLEVPDSDLNVHSGDFSLWEEHVNFFTERSLSRLLEANGFKPILTYRSLFSGRCLTIVSSFTADSRTDGALFRDVCIQRDVAAARQWATSLPVLRERLGQELARISEDREIVLLGVGSRSCVQINLLHLQQYVSRFVDDNTAKQGRYIPGSGLRVMSWEESRELQSQDSFVLMGVNAENEAVLMQRLDLLPGINCASVLPPSNHLLESWYVR